MSWGQPGSAGERSGAAGESGGSKGKPPPASRWSYVMQDIPEVVRGYVNDINKGYAIRLTLAVTTAGALSYGAYHVVFVRGQESTPYAKRRYPFFVNPRVPLILVEKRREKNSSMDVLVFRLPQAYDYTGYDPVSSVMLASGRVKDLESVSRLYTPISHPQQRGTVSFAIKDCDPGRMCSRLRHLAIGDTVYMGRWYKEFDYTAYKQSVARERAAASIAPDGGRSLDTSPMLGRGTQAAPSEAGAEKGRELGLVCTTSGASIALQLMAVLDKDRRDPTRLKFLYCHHTANDIPFEEVFERFQRRNPGRIEVRYNVQSLAKRPAREAEEDYALQQRIEVSQRIAVESLHAAKPANAWATLGIGRLLSLIGLHTSSPATCGGSTETVDGVRKRVSDALWAEEESKRTDGGRHPRARVRLGDNFFVGNIDPSIVRVALPPPIAIDEVTQEQYHPMVLACGPQSMLSALCGRTSPIGHKGYWRGPWYKFGGFMKDMGYQRKQVYKFGVSTHLLAYQ